MSIPQPKSGRRPSDRYKEVIPVEAAASQVEEDQEDQEDQEDLQQILKEDIKETD